MEAPEIDPKAPLLNQAFSGQASGKINLILRIPGRLENGYHLIESIIAPISLADDVSLKVTPVVKNAGTEFNVRCVLSPELLAHTHCESISDPRVEDIVASLSSSDNIVIKAARAFFTKLGSLGEFGVDIEIYKRIPFGAGLGGGSADAGIVLKLLNQAFQNPLRVEELAVLGAEIGSDVAALVSGEINFAYGTGGNVLAVEDRKGGKGEFSRFARECELVIIKPPITVSSELAYESLGLPRIIPNSALRGHFPPKESGIWSDLRELSLDLSEASPTSPDAAKAREMLTFFDTEGSSGGLDSVCCASPLGSSAGESLTCFDRTCRTLRNDFEETIFGQFSEIKLAREILESSGVVYTLLAGSGSSVVGFIKDSVQASAVEKLLQARVPSGWFVVRASICVPGRESGVSTSGV